MNVVVLQGALAGKLDRRELATGETVIQFDLRAPVGDAVEAVPVAWAVGRTEPSLAVGDELVVLGRVRRRFFRVGGGTQSRTEVVAEQVIPVRQRKRVANAVGERCAALAGLGGAPAG